MKFYIKKLEEANKQILLIKRLKRNYHNLNFYYIENAAGCAKLVVRDLEDNFIDEYQITNFNVVKINNQSSRENKFEEIISTDAIRKIYIRFMKDNFSEFREDYLKACNNTALDNLGELNNEMWK